MLRNHEEDGSEGVCLKVNSRSFRNLHRHYFNSVLNSAAKSKFQIREKIRLLVFTFLLTVHLIKKSHAVFVHRTEKKCTKICAARAE